MSAMKKQWLGIGVAGAVLLAGASGAVAQEKPKSAAAAPAAAAQKTFDSPKAAADALIAAASNDDIAALKEILGPDSKSLIETSDAVQTKNQLEGFAEQAKKNTAVVLDPKNPDRATISVGDDDWPMPIPIVKKNGRWLFDSKAGKRELIYRRIGRNELDAIDVCYEYVEAQREYALEKHEGSQVNQYAQKIISTAGKKDGLAWRNPDGSVGGPISETVADAIAEGYSKKSEPLHGYYFKVLKGQGPAAPLGKLDFVVQGAMIGGFALAAAPSDYRVTGVMTFIVSHDGIVYQKDLGPHTLEIFQKMDRYNPDKTWTKVDEETGLPEAPPAPAKAGAAESGSTGHP
jgi:hypothetical protein